MGADADRERNQTIAYDPNMKDLYKRLRDSGFDTAFVRQAVLPDWWEDSLAATPSNRAIAETAISRLLGFPMAALRKPSAPLELPARSNFRLKRNAKTRIEDVRPAVHVAERIAKMVVESLPPIPPFTPVLSSQQIRQAILEANPCVNLTALVQFCWDHGIVVIHVNPDRLPKKRFHGAAMFVADTPVLVLGSVSDSPPWLAFHLAHEMGHIFKRNVRAGDRPIVDNNLDRLDDDEQECAADRFATEVLTGRPELGFQSEYGLTARKLAVCAERYGTHNAIDPGTVALIYGRSANRWPVAQNALKYLEQDRGGQEAIAKALAERLNLDELPESSARFLSCLSFVPA